MLLLDMLTSQEMHCIQVTHSANYSVSHIVRYFNCTFPFILPKPSPDSYLSAVIVTYHYTEFDPMSSFRLVKIAIDIEQPQQGHKRLIYCKL